jgi:hypothetical protein
MNIKKITDDITYYNNIADTFKEEREILRTAGIGTDMGPDIGLIVPEKRTLDFWVDSVGVERIHGEMWIPDNEVSDKRSYSPGNLNEFDKIINDCIKEYKESHSIDKKTAPVISTIVKRNKKGHNLRPYSIGEGYNVVLYLNNDYVGGQISFSTKDEISVNPLVHPKYPENIDQIDAWIKPEPCTVIIAPSNIKITEHLITSWNRYTISAEF